MGRTCTVCQHGERPAIDRVLLSGVGYRDISGRFDLSKTAVARHRAEHIPATLARAKAAEDIADADDLLAELDQLKRPALGILDRAEDADDLRTALSAIREARTTIETLLEVAGELDRSGSVNILMSPEWMTVQTCLLVALEPFPEARIAAADALMTLDTGIPS